jgi:hypothetical protein
MSWSIFIRVIVIRAIRGSFMAQGQRVPSWCLCGFSLLGLYKMNYHVTEASA